MDLRSIINTDSISNPPLRPRPSQDSPVKQVYHAHQPLTQNTYDGVFHEDPRPNLRPRQPPPLQPPGHRELQSPSGSYSQRSAQSPYQSTPTSSLSLNQYPFPQPPHQQSPNHQGYGPPFQQREQHTTIITGGGQGYGQPSPSILTPTSITPSSAFPHQQYHRPQSSHSAATPNSAQSHVQNFPKDSPHATHTQANPPPYAYPAQNYQSQPGTPLGPPPPIGRPSPVQHRDSSGPVAYELRSQSGSSYNSHQISGPSPTADIYAGALASPVAYSSRPQPSQGQSYRSEEDRERSLSVSPKTRLPSQTKSEQMDVTPDADRPWSGGVTPAKRKLADSFPEARPFIQLQEQPQLYHEQYAESKPSDGLTFETFAEQARSLKDTQVAPLQQPLHTLSPTMATTTVMPHFSKDSDHLVPQGHLSSKSSSATPSRQQPTTPQFLSNQRTPGSHTSPTPPSARHPTPSFLAAPSGSSSIPVSMERAISPATPGSPQQPTRKRQRFDSPPIYAQSSRRNGRMGGANPLIPNRRHASNRAVAPVKQEGNESRDQGFHHSSPQVNNEESNGHLPPTNDIVVPKAQPISTNEAALGPWEHSIIDMLPSEELTRTIADFLFTEVVLRDDVGAGHAGSDSGPGAVLEIEAKFGQLIDKNTNERLRLPVMTECIVSKNDPNLRIAFKSSMTETQHRGLNQFLNEALKKSLPGFSSSPRPRVPMTYVHTRECDSFYEVSQAAELSLPPTIRSQIIPRHNKAKVRITTDQKTGRVLAKIVKVRVADLDVHSPKTQFDWRVSINLEMKFDGDMRDLVEVTEAGKRAPERNKDRMTYRHLAYQIDLTQVTMAEATPNVEKEHELEIELSAAEVRKHGNLLKGGLANGYEDLVRGFVDNVRVLSRLFPK